MVECVSESQNNDACEAMSNIQNTREMCNMTTQSRDALNSQYVNEVQRRFRPSPQGYPTYSKGEG